MASSETASLVDDVHARGATEAGDHLVLIMNGARPFEAPMAVPLAGIDEVILGRGAARRTTVKGRAVRVDIVDDAMSTRHARLVRGDAGWSILDEGSKNGTWIDGARLTRAEIGP